MLKKGYRGGGKPIYKDKKVILPLQPPVGKHGYGLYTVDNKKYEYFDLDNLQPYLNFKISDIEDINNDKEILING